MAGRGFMVQLTGSAVGIVAGGDKVVEQGEDHIHHDKITLSI